MNIQSRLEIALDFIAALRAQSSPHNTIWDLLFSRTAALDRLGSSLRTGRHRFEPVEIFRQRNGGDWLERWSAADAVLLKAIALWLTPMLGRLISSRCFHSHRPRGRRVRCGSSTPLSPPETINSSFLDRTIYRNGYYRAPRAARRAVTQGIGRGSPLAPLLGAVYLAEMDEKLEGLARKHGLFYARFMDDRVEDWVILSPTRWKLRRAIRVTNECLASLKVEQHPEKTFIGRVEQGFDFLGCQFEGSGLTGVSHQSTRRFAEEVTRRLRAGADAGEIWAFGGLRPRRESRKKERVSRLTQPLQQPKPQLIHSHLHEHRGCALSRNPNRCDAESTKFSFRSGQRCEWREKNRLRLQERDHPQNCDKVVWEWDREDGSEWAEEMRAPAWVGDRGRKRFGSCRSGP